MPYKTLHYYVTTGGLTINGAEYWQTGVRFASGNGTPVNAADMGDVIEDGSVVHALLLASNKLMQGNAPTWPGTTSVTFAKIAVIGPDGKYAGPPSTEEQPPKLGAGGASAYFPQLALCASLRSGQTFGWANHGRMYFPPPQGMTPDINTGMATPSAYLTQLRSAVVTLLADWEVAINTKDGGKAWEASIMSTKGAGYTKPVAFVGVGSAMDTQRSRRSHINDAVPSFAPSATLRRLAQQRGEELADELPADKLPF